MASDRAGEILKGRYTLIRQIGRGGFADVWLATDADYRSCKVAVKILHQWFTKDEDIVRRFFDEAKLVGSINARNIVTVFDYGVSNNHHFFVMEYLQGPTLRQALKERPSGVITWTRALTIISQICDGLTNAANDYSVAHRDLKPENIFLSNTHSGVHVTIVDFGIAKIVDEQALSSYATGPTTTGLIGTPIYMAPELTKRLRGDEFPAEMYFQADIYSLGVMLYEMLTGSPPFEGPDAEVLCQHLAVTPMRPRLVHPGLELSESVEALVMRCLEKSPYRRYQSAEELGEATRSILRGETLPEADTLAGATTEAQTLRPTAAAEVVGQCIAYGGTKPLEPTLPGLEGEQGASCGPPRRAMCGQFRAFGALVSPDPGVGSRRSATTDSARLSEAPVRGFNAQADHEVASEPGSATLRSPARTGVYTRLPRMPLFTKIVIGSTLISAFVSMCTIGAAILVFSSTELQGSVFGQPRAMRQRRSVVGGPRRRGRMVAPAREKRSNPTGPGDRGREEPTRGASPLPPAVSGAPSIVLEAALDPSDSMNPTEAVVSGEPAQSEDHTEAEKKAPKIVRPPRPQTMEQKVKRSHEQVLAKCAIKSSSNLKEGGYTVIFTLNTRTGKHTVKSMGAGAPLEDKDCVLRVARRRVSFVGASDLRPKLLHTYEVRAKRGSAASVPAGSGMLRN